LCVTVIVGGGNIKFVLYRQDTLVLQRVEYKMMISKSHTPARLWARNRVRTLSIWNRVLFIVCCVFLPGSLFAAQITGTATNGTTNKPAAGDVVVLMSLAGGMDEVGRTSTDSQGRFTINVPEDGAQHLVQVVHGGVNYNHVVPPGTITADVTVYDSAKQVDNISIDGRIFRLQTARGQLEVSETYAVENASIPPRTKMADRTFEVTLPEGAQLSDASVAGPGGMSTTTSTEPTGKKNQYAFVYPIRPGKSQFQVFYKLPYSGSYEFAVTPEASVAELGVLLPKSMQFNSTSLPFAQDTDESGMNVFFVKSVAAKQHVKFSVSGEGAAPAEGQTGGPQGGAGASVANPGGGTPVDASGPSNTVGWYIFGAILVVVAGGVFWMVQTRTSSSSRADSGASSSRRSTAKPERSQRTPQPSRTPPPMAEQNTTMLDALKDELFQLETDRLNGKISEKDYEASKAGLDALFRRQMKTKKIGNS